jgi:hypothetical protein
MRLRLSFGIFPKLLLTMLVVTLIPLGAIWYLDYRAESESLAGQIEQRLSSQADTMAGYVDAWVDMNVRMLRQNAAIEDMSSMDALRQKPLLRAIVAEYKWVYLAFTIAPDGNNIGRNDEEAPRFYGDRGYFKQAIEGRQVGQEVVVSRTTGQPAAILAVPVWKLDQVVGVLAAGTSVSEVSSTITNARMSKVKSSRTRARARASRLTPPSRRWAASPRSRSSSRSRRASASSPSPRRRATAGRSSPSRITTRPTRLSPWPIATPSSCSASRSSSSSWCRIRWRAG